MITRVLCKMVIVLSLLLPWTSVESQSEGPIDKAFDARRSYDDGLVNRRHSSFVRASETLLELRGNLEEDRSLMLRYQSLYPKTAYKLGWCYFRRGELSARTNMLDSAIQWFSVVPTNAPDSTGVYAAYMAAEAQLRRAILSKFEMLSRGNDGEQMVGTVRGFLDRSRQGFREVIDALAETNPVRRCAEIRYQDAVYELARLVQAADDIAQAEKVFQSIDYLALDRPPHTDIDREINAILRYLDATVLLERYLIRLDSAMGAELERKLADFGSDVHLRTGNKAQADTMFDAAISAYDKTIDPAGINEGYYWLGFVHLIQSRDERQLRKSRDAFDRFLNAVGDDTLRLCRLRPLARSARHKKQVLDIALGGSVPQEFLSMLTREDLKFLIRVAASTSGRVSDRCLETLERFLRQADNLSENEARFYRGLVVSLRAEAAGGPRRRARFEDAANILSAVGGEYAGEAKYVRARSLSQAFRIDEANQLLRELIRDYGSVRALYALGVNYGQASDLVGEARLDTLCRIFRTVVETIESTGMPADYVLFKLNAQTRDSICEARAVVPLRVAVEGIESLRCPENLSVDTDGPEPELIFYETLADYDFIRRKYVQKSLEQLRKFGLPKKSLYPAKADRRLDGSMFLNRSFENVTASVPDEIPIDSTWRPRLQFLSTTEKPIRIVDSCLVTSVSESRELPCEDSSGYYVVKADIDLNEEVSIIVSKGRYYTTFRRYTSEAPGYADLRVALAERVEYRSDGRDALQHVSSYLGGRRDKNVVLYDLAESTPQLPASLIDRFSSDIDLRDFAYDKKNRRFLAVNCNLTDRLLVYFPTGPLSGTEELMLNFKPASRLLDSPEGIAVDAEGDIYVADWGNQRVVVFDPDGNELYEVGEMGAGGRLVFPTRVTIEEDFTGIQFDSDTTYRERHVLVADRYGVHKFDSEGRYLDSPVRTGSHDGLGHGSCYALAVRGYGRNSIICLADRQKGALSFFAPKK